MKCVGIEDSFEGILGETHTVKLTQKSVSGILPRGGTILGTRNRGSFVKMVDGKAALPGDADRRGVGKSRYPWDRGVDRARRRRNAGDRGAVSQARVSGHRRSEDDRQRSRRDRVDVRIYDRDRYRDRGARPAAHDRRVARPRDDPRGDGSQHRLDRAACGTCGKRGHHSDSRDTVLVRIDRAKGARTRRKRFAVYEYRRRRRSEGSREERDVFRIRRSCGLAASATTSGVVSKR